MPKLFESIKYGAVKASNRIVMAPLTRGRATREHAPTKIMADYYSQRASAGLIITEGIGISQEGLGFPHAPGIWTNAQVDGWRVVTDAVHAAGGVIFAQMWHMGRVTHPSFNNGEKSVSASSTISPHDVHTYEGKKSPEYSRALQLHEFPRLIDDYRRAAANAIKAGFDGVELHAGNGYLIDQFLRDNSNFRTDEYGGSVENRVKFLTEVTSALIDAAGNGRTAVRFSPNGRAQGVNDSNPHALFSAAAKALSPMKIAFIEVREAPVDGDHDKSGSRGRPEVDPVAPVIRAAFEGTLILNSDYDLARAEHVLANGSADAVSFGRSFIANPDLPRRLREGLALNPIDESRLYTNGAEGYSDYPMAAEPALS